MSLVDGVAALLGKRDAKEAGGPLFWIRRERELHADMRRARSSLANATSEIAGDLLEGGKGDFSDAKRASVEIESLTIAIAACRDARAKAIREKFAAEAELLRHKLSGLHSMLGALKEERAVHLRGIAALEEVPLSALQMSCERSTGELGPNAGIFAGCGFRRLRSERIEQEIYELNQQIPAAERRELQDDGGVNVTGDFEDLLAAVGAHPSRVPSIEAIENWFGACETLARKRIGASFAGRECRIVLEWRGAEIAMSSYVYVAHFAGIAPPFDIARGMFRVAA